MKGEKKQRKNVDRGGGGSDENLTPKTDYPSPSESHISPPIPATPINPHAKRPFSRQYGLKYPLLSTSARQILHATARSTSLPMLPIGNQPQLDPVQSARALQLLEEIMTTQRAISFHQDYFPRRHEERAIMEERLHLNVEAYQKHMKEWLK